MYSECRVICDRCFRETTKCEVFSMNNAVKCIGEYAFSSPALRLICFSQTNGGSWLWVKDHAFDETPMLTSLELPECQIHLGAHVFGPALEKLRFFSPVLPECEPDTFASATGLRKIIVPRESLDAYTALLSRLCPGAKVEPYLNDDEKKALKKARKEKLNQERIEKEKEKDARVQDATVRVFLPAGQRTEIRWIEKSSLSSVPTIVSQSHPQAIIEVQFGKKPDSKCAYKVDITNLKDWDKLRKKIDNFYYNGKKVVYADWHMHPKAPKIAHIILSDLLDGNADDSRYTLNYFRSGRDNTKAASILSKDYCEFATLDDLEGQGLMLEYLIKLDPEGFNVGKFTFFSFKGKNVSDHHELCADLSRQDKVRTRNKASLAEYHRELEERRELNDKTRRIRQEGMWLFERVIDNWVSPSADEGILDRIDDVEEHSDADDNIVWFDFINYADQFGTLMKVYRVNDDNSLEELNVKA